MYYEINVSLDGQHYFATAKRSITRVVKAKALYSQFKILFPADKGYKITVSLRQETGQRIDFESGE